MTSLFLQILNMSMTASWLIVVVIFIRFLMQKAPKGIRYILWALVGIRLLCPFSIESALSLIPSAEVFSEESLYSENPEIHTGVTVVDKVVYPLLTVPDADKTPEIDADATLDTPMNPSSVPDQGTAMDNVNTDAETIFQDSIYMASVVWLLGIVGLLIYATVSYLRLRSTLKASMQVEDKIWICDKIQSPFIIGLVSPRIYMPSYISEEHKPYIVAHEMEHLRYGDHWWKPLGFAILTVHWFNPLVWVAYILMCRDIELACDERVIRTMGVEEKKNYSKSLLICSNPRHFISACPVAFGEVGVKERIKKIVDYKKPSVWIAGIGVLVCIIVAICFMTNPKEDALIDGTEDTELGTEVANEDFVRNEGAISAEELRWFQEEFFKTENANITLFLNSEYNLPSEINLFKTFYAGMLDENRENPTQAEIDALIEKYELDNNVIFVVKISAESMDAALQKYMNITLTETEKIGLENFYYLEEYDAYYAITADVDGPVPIIESGWRDAEGGLVEIRYYDDPDYGGDGALYRVQLKEKDGNYYFVSNQKVSNIYENPISQEKLEWFETVFFNNDENSITNMFLTSEYAKPADIDLHYLFYGGVSGNGSGQVSQEEKHFLEQEYNIEIMTDVAKVTRIEMDDILQKYINLTREETNLININNLYYLEEYDAFYNVAGDTMMSKYDFEGGWINENGTITLQYRDALGNFEETRQVTLREVGGTYHFVSNVVVERTVNVDVNTDELTLIQKVLFNKAPYSLDQWIGEVDGIYWSGSNDDYWKWVKFFNVDLDRDGVDEVCVEYAPGLVLIFNEIDGVVYGHEIFFRGFNPVYVDGTFAGSDGAAYTKLYGNVSFTEYGMSYDTLIEEFYIVDHIVEVVEKYDFTVENILKYVD